MKKLSLVALCILSMMASACGRGQLFDPSPTPTPTFTLTPTITLTPTLTPTSTPTYTVTNTQVPQGPCDNPLVPLGKNNQWIYQVSSSNDKFLFQLSSLDIRDEANITASIEYVDQQKNLTMHDSIICQQSAIVNYPLIVLNMVFSKYLDKYIDSVHLDVDYAPSYQSLVGSEWIKKWQSGYLTENDVALKDPASANVLLIPINTHIDVSFNLTGESAPITTPAGYFPHALKLIQDYTVPITFTSIGSGVGTADTLRIQMIQWYEPYVGLVRSEVTSVTIAFVQVLPLGDTLELMEYKH